MKRGQLFLIEVIISITVLIILVTAMFSTVNFSPPVDTSELYESGENAIDILVETGAMEAYVLTANYSYYTLDETLVDVDNADKVVVDETISSSIPLIAEYKAYTYKFDGNEWKQLDIVNFDASISSGSDIAVVEYYMPGFDGVFEQYRFQIYLWYEVIL